MITHFLFFPFNLFTTTITIFFIFFLSNPSCVNSHPYDECSSLQSCGNVSHIGYPFWGNTRPSYCGGGPFQLNCTDSNHYPLLQIKKSLSYDHDLYFNVLHISNIRKNNSNIDETYITIKLLHKSSSGACPFFFTKNALFQYFFNYNSNVNVTRLYYDCHNNKTVASDFVTCFDIDNQNHGYSYSPNGKGFEGCKYIEFPVLKQELNKLQLKKEALVDVLRKGFEVDLQYSWCTNCEESGGVCGSSEHEVFACYCKDNSQPHYNVCPKSEKRKLKLIFEVVGLCVLIASNVLFCRYMKKIKFWISSLLCKTCSCHTMSDLERGHSFLGIPVFSYNELQEATNNFDSARELGDGGFGVVYYGKLRDGREVAVKRLYEKNFKRVGQFMNEVEILTNLCHQNLVKLYGCTSRHSKELLLVYEFVPNGTVADHLYGNSRSRTEPKYETLPWNIRMKIAIQTASALSYLHASDIIHRDVKTKNILLDNNFTVRVADFGLSRLFPFDATHVLTAPQGTPGYLDPEYQKSYQVTSKSDVYSFGVVLVELISSLPAIDINRHENEINLSDYAMNRIQKGELETLVDRNLCFEPDFKVKRMTTLVAEIAFQCLQQEKEFRPSMEEVSEALQRIKSVDYEALESKEMGWSMGLLKSPNSMVEENNVDHRQEHPRSPKSVIENCGSRSSVASDPSS